MGHRAQIGVVAGAVGELLGFGDLFFDVGIAAEGVDDTFEVALFPGDALELCHVTEDGRVGHLVGQVFVALDDAVQTIKHHHSSRHTCGCSAASNNPKPLRRAPERLVGVPISN